jgi:hypothetical protein
MSYGRASLSKLSSSQRIALVTIVCVLWTIIALVLDHFMIFKHFAGLGKCLLLQLKLSSPAGEIDLPEISVIVLLGVPLLALGLALIPWRSIGDRSAWYTAFMKWCQPVFWFLIAIVLTIVGQSLFLLSKEHLPKGLVELSEKFSLDITLKSWEFTFATLKGSLSALVGLVVGSYLFLQKGVRAAFD